MANVKSNISQTLTENISTKGPTFSSSKPQIINNQFYGVNSDDNSLYDDTKFEVSNHAVVVSSPAYGEEISSSYFPTEASVKTSQHGSSHSQSFSTEIPSRIHPTITSTSSEEANDLPNSIQFSKYPYDHSDISYSPSDAETLMENDNNLISQYPMSTPETFFTETRTEASEKQKYTKPIFKLKPTQYPSSTEKYVLVHTISNDKQSEGNLGNPTNKPTTNESIQSIIWMLNGSNPGPEYNVETNNYNSEAASTASYGSTSMIDREKYGSSSYYITTKSPSNRPTTLNVPSTSYVYSPNPTRRPTTSKTTTKVVNKLKVTPTKSPQKPTTLNVPSTSYVYSPNPITKRPTATASSTVSSTTAIKTETASIIKKTTTRPSIIVKQPSPGDVESNYVVISGGGITKHPSPTVHITPKPITNILTSSTTNQMNNKQTKKPLGEKSPTPSSSASASVTQNPPFYSTTPGTFISSSIYVPAIQDFHNEGYFVVTHRPPGGVSSTAVYTINPGSLNAHPLTDENIKIPNDPVNLHDDAPTLNNNDDFSNFPPVRNPNLNMSATNAILDESDISTPAFVQDEQLNSKIDLLVNKLVASMQGNLDNLIDIVYERKNVSAAEQAISNLNKNGTLLDASKPTRSPSKVTTPKAPSRVTTGRPSSQQTTKKAPTKTSTTSKKPATGNRRTTLRPTVNSQTTKRPPSRITTAATKKPTRKVTTTSTTAKAPVEDELVEEEEEGEGEVAGEEETVEENEGEETVAEESEDDNTSPPVESGKIRKKYSN